jgi:hypothetical protein
MMYYICDSHEPNTKVIDVLTPKNENCFSEKMEIVFDPPSEMKKQQQKRDNQYKGFTVVLNPKESSQEENNDFHLGFRKKKTLKHL